jgi:hypothetical protein
MSVDKIKERIRMIENNDFTTTGETVNEALTGSKSEVGKIFEPNNIGTVNKIMNKVKAGLGLSTRDQDLLKTLSVSDRNTDDIQNAADQLLGRGMRVNVGGDEYQIPRNFESTIFPIYTLMKQHKVLTDEIDQNSFKAFNGYIRTTLRHSQIENVLVLMKKKLIMVEFTDEKLTNLTRLYIKNNRNFDQNDFQGFFNDLNNNKSRYKINSASLTNSGQLITIDF